MRLMTIMAVLTGNLPTTTAAELPPILQLGQAYQSEVIATNAAIGLMEPTSCDLGGDIFAIVYNAKTKKLNRLNAVPDAVMKELGARGQIVRRTKLNGGGYQGILIDPKTGVLHGGTESRKDGAAAGW